MTVSSSVSRNEYNGNAVTTTFAYTFRILDEEHIAVYVDGSLQTITVDYSVTGVGVSGGGDIEFVSAPASGTGNVVILRDVPFTQESDYVENDTFPAEVLEDALDQLTMLAQQNADVLTRSVRSPIIEDALSDLPIATARANKALIFGADGDVTVSTDDYEDQVVAAAAEAAAAAASAAAALISENTAAASEAAAAISETNAQTAYNDSIAIYDSLAAVQAAQTAAETAQTNAETAETNAETAETNAEAARDSLLAAASIYADTTAGLAATASGGYFWVPSSSANEAYILYLDNAGTAVEQKRVASYTAIDDIYHERLAAAYAKAMELKRLRVEKLQKPKAAVVVLLGQSNNAARNTPVTGTVDGNSYMPAGGNSLEYFDFYAGNAESVAHWDDIGASPVTHAEGVEQTPCSGVITGLSGGPFGRAYIASIAIGSRTLLSLGSRGPRCNLYAVVHKLCDHARTAGYEPVVMYATHHGEAEMAASVSESDYYTHGWGYYRMCQMVAAQAMDLPDYDAPIVFRMPITMMSGVYSRGVHSAIRRLAQDIPNGIGPVASYPYVSESDRTHQTAIGFVEKGEADGRYLRDFFQRGQRHLPVMMVDAVRSTTTVTVTFNQEITIDTNFDWGENLNTANAYAGVEYTYDGTNYTAVNSITVQGQKAILTLASDPGVYAATEEVRVAMQTTTGTLTAGSNNRPGSQIRSNVDAGFLSPYDYTYRHYAWAVSQTIAVR